MSDDHPNAKEDIDTLFDHIMRFGNPTRPSRNAILAKAWAHVAYPGWNLGWHDTREAKP